MVLENVVVKVVAVVDCVPVELVVVSVKVIVSVTELLVKLKLVVESVVVSLTVLLVVLTVVVIVAVEKVVVLLVDVRDVFVVVEVTSTEWTSEASGVPVFMRLCHFVAWFPRTQQLI